VWSGAPRGAPEPEDDALRQNVLAILVGTALGTAAVCGIEWRNPSAADRDQQIYRISSPAPEADAARRRIGVKNNLARRIIAERIALLEAVDLFYDANGEDGINAVARSIPGHSIREKLCRQVIGYVGSVETELEREGGTGLSDPRWSAVLRAEFDRLLAAGEFPPEPGEY
jgi:hypothetical protein